MKRDDTIFLARTFVTALMAATLFVVGCTKQAPQTPAVVVAPPVAVAPAPVAPAAVAVAPAPVVASTVAAPADVKVTANPVKLAPKAIKAKGSGSEKAAYAKAYRNAAYANDKLGRHAFKVTATDDGQPVPVTIGKSWDLPATGGDGVG